MLLVKLLGGPWLGHGRLTEFILAVICGLYGVVLFFDPSASFDSQATRDIAWQGYGHLISIPFVLKSSLTGLGLIANINGWPYSRFLRLCGASLGSFIWVWMVSKFFLAGVPMTFGSVCAVVFFFMSVRILGMALVDLPKPGVPGILGAGPS